MNFIEFYDKMFWWYNFDYINIELIDIESDGTVMHYSNSGFSENCQPLSGTIFSDVVQEK